MARRSSTVERRRHILAAARGVFARKGYAGARMLDIAEGAKVGKGTLYEYFESKEDLFSTLVLTAARDSLETLPRAAYSTDPETALRETIEFLVRAALEENLDLYGLFFDFWGAAGVRRVEVQKGLREVAESFREFVRDLVRRGQASGAFVTCVDPDSLTDVLLAAVDGMSLRLVIHGEKYDLGRYAEELHTLLIGGLTRPSPMDGASVLKERE